MDIIRQSRFGVRFLHDEALAVLLVTHLDLGEGELGGGGDSIEKFGLNFGFKSGFSFGLRFPTIRKCSKMGSLDMSQNLNGISSHFPRKKLKLFFSFFY